jgi:hypothetical protein
MKQRHESFTHSTTERKQAEAGPVTCLYKLLATSEVTLVA